MKKTIGIVLAMLSFSCQSKEKEVILPKIKEPIKMENQNMEIATFAGGCFWCTEAVFSELEGVKSVVSGYTGGKTINPTYKEICNGDTGHAEAIQITFDPIKLVSGHYWKYFLPPTIQRL